MKMQVESQVVGKRKFECIDTLLFKIDSNNIVVVNTLV